MGRGAGGGGRGMGKGSKNWESSGSDTIRRATAVDVQRFPLMGYKARDRFIMHAGPSEAFELQDRELSLLSRAERSLLKRRMSSLHAQAWEDESLRAEWNAAVKKYRSGPYRGAHHPPLIGK